MRERDYAFEALTEVTNSDPSVARGQLNAALRDIKIQEPDITDSYLLSAEIHERAKMYRSSPTFAEMTLTPNALAKHWTRLKQERPKVRGVNLHAPEPEPERPVSSRERNLEEARKILAMFEK